MRVWIEGGYPIDLLNPLAAEQPGFYAERQAQVKDDGQKQPGPERHGQWDESQYMSQRGYGKPEANGDNENGGEEKRPAGAALNKRNPVGANHVNDQGLSEERFNEPTGLEYGGVGGIPAVKQVEQDEIGGVIKDRTQGADE